MGETFNSIELFVPGRLCLFGEHSDWAGKYMDQNPDTVEGQAIVTGLNLGIYANAHKDDMFRVKSFDADGVMCEFECEMDLEQLKDKALYDEFFCYCCGTAAYMLENHHVGGVSIDITKMTLPIKKGLSSSAAICVLVARTFNSLYKLNLSIMGIMRAAYSGERLTRSRCGRLDQACAFGEQPVLMHFTGDEIAVDRIKVGANLYWVFADLCAKKDTKKILSELNRAFPFAQNETYQNVQDALGHDNHVIVKNATKAIEDGDAKTLGELMCDAQALFDRKIAPACPEELMAPVLHSVLSDKTVKKLIYGAKGVGSQGDGTVQFLARDKASQLELIDYLNNDLHMEALPFELQAGGRIRRAIIPIAGYGTRMYPETHFIKKAFMPIVDREGVVKPVLLYILEELDSAGIEEVILVVGKGETEEYKKFFEYYEDEVFAKKLSETVRNYYSAIRRYSGKISYVEQIEKRGLGHALYQVKDLLHGEPAMMMLGDFIYKSACDISCAMQTIKAYNEVGGNKTVISVKKVPVEDTKNYGTLYGDFENDSHIMKVKSITEKPSIDFAKEHLAVKTSNGTDSYYVTFGEYVLTDEVFIYLENHIKNTSADSGREIDLTEAFNHLLEEDKLVGVEIKGESFDVGTPELYYNSFVNFHK